MSLVVVGNTGVTGSKSANVDENYTGKKTQREINLFMFPRLLFVPLGKPRIMRQDTGLNEGYNFI